MRVSRASLWGGSGRSRWGGNALKLRQIGETSQLEGKRNAGENSEIILVAAFSWRVSPVPEFRLSAAGDWGGAALRRIVALPALKSSGVHSKEKN